MAAPTGKKPSTTTPTHRNPTIPAVVVAAPPAAAERKEIAAAACAIHPAVAAVAEPAVAPPAVIALVPRHASHHLRRNAPAAAQIASALIPLAAMLHASPTTPARAVVPNAAARKLVIATSRAIPCLNVPAMNLIVPVKTRTAAPTAVATPRHPASVLTTVAAVPAPPAMIAQEIATPTRTATAKEIPATARPKTPAMALVFARSICHANVQSGKTMAPTAPA